jgi:HEAT repeat protein
VLAKMPAENTADTAQCAAQIIKQGPAAIKDICGLLVAPGKGDDAKAQFALSAVANAVMKPGAEPERKMVSLAFGDALTAAVDKDIKAFLISQLELVAKDEAIGALSGYLADDRLCDPATRALVTIDSPAAVEALLKALPAAQGANRVALIQALGEVRCKAAAASIAPLAKSDDRNTRGAALSALANIGDPAASAVLKQAASGTASAIERAEATADYLLLAQRLAEAGKRKPCEDICRKLLASRTAPEEAHVPCAALSMLVTLKGKKALPDLLAAMDSPNREFRAAALQLSSAVPGKTATKKWLTKMEKTSPEVQREIIGMLGGRGDTTALPAALAALKCGNEDLRMTAVDAAAKLGGSDAVPALVAAMQSAIKTDANQETRPDDEKRDVKAIKEALLLLPTDAVVQDAAKAVPGSTAPVQIALIQILAERRATAQLDLVMAQTQSPSAGVRVAAKEALASLASERDLPKLVAFVRDAPSEAEEAAARKALLAVAKKIADPEARATAVLAELAKNSADAKLRLLGTLPALGGKKALEAVVAETKNADAKLKDGAIRALSEWPDAAAAPELLRVMRECPDETLHVLALRGYVRLVDAAEIPAGEKTRRYQEALAALQRPDDIKLVLAGLGDVRSLEALQAIAKYLDDKAVQTDAALAAVKSACPKDDKDKGLTGPDVAAVLKKAAPLLQDAEARKKVEAYIAAMPPPEAK